MTSAFHAILIHGVRVAQLAPILRGVIPVSQAIWRSTRLSARKFVLHKLIVWQGIKTRQVWGELFATHVVILSQQLAHTVRVIPNAKRYFLQWTISAIRGMMITASISIKHFVESAWIKLSAPILQFHSVRPTTHSLKIKSLVPNVWNVCKTKIAMPRSLFVQRRTILARLTARVTSWTLAQTWQLLNLVSATLTISRRVAVFSHVKPWNPQEYAQSLMKMANISTLVEMLPWMQKVNISLLIHNQVAYIMIHWQLFNLGSWSLSKILK